MNTVQQSLFFKIDPRVKLLFILSVGGIITGSTPEWWQFMLVGMAAFFCINERMYKTAVKFTVSYTVMWIVIEVLGRVAAVNPVTTSVILICVISKRFVPAIMGALALVRTTTVSELMAVADKMKIPYRFVIPLAVLIRYFPTLREEWDNIRMAMKMRGIKFNLEYVMVPILSCSVRIGDELSAAALSRGLGYAEKRTNMCQVKLKLTDYIFMVSFIINGILTYGNIL